MKRRELLKTGIAGLTGIACSKGKSIASAVDSIICTLYVEVISKNNESLFPKRQFKYYKKEFQVEYTQEDFASIKDDTLMKEVRICDEKGNIVWVHILGISANNRDSLTLHLPESMSRNLLRLWEINHNPGYGSGYSLT